MINKKTNYSFPVKLEKKRLFRKSIVVSLFIVPSIFIIPVLTAKPFGFQKSMRESLSIGISNLKPDIDPNWQEELVSLAIDYSEKLNLSPNEKINAKPVNKSAYLLAQIWVESHFIPSATSVSNAQGLMQVKPATGRVIAPRFGIPKRKSYYDIKENLDLGIAHMNSMISLFGSLKSAAYAYNIGSVPFRRGIKNDFYWERIEKAYTILSPSFLARLQ